MVLDQFLKLFNFKFKLFRHYLRSGFLIDVMACLPYDILDSFSAYTSSYTDILSILKASISNIIIIIIIIIYNYVYSISTLEPSFDWKLSFPSKSHLIHFFKPSQGIFPAVLPSSPFKLWGKSVKCFMTFKIGLTKK